MRVLLTGCTRIMAGDPLGRNTSYVSFVPLLLDLLRQMDNVAVTQTAVIPSEPVKDFIQSEFDLVLVGMAAVNGFAGKRHRWGAMWLMSFMPHIMYVDDWQVGALISSLRREKETWKTALLTREELAEREAALLFKDDIERVRRHLYHSFTTGEHGTVLAPLFEWGDLQKFREVALPCKRLFSLDPSWLVPRIIEPADRTYYENKERAWAYAGLKDHHRFFNKQHGLTWPLKVVMPQQGKRGGWNRITESQVVNELYDPVWGNIVVPYPAKLRGTGWWRSRYNFADQAGNVLWVSHDDLGKLDYTLFPSFAEVEALDDDQLEELQIVQSDYVRSHHPNNVVLTAALRTYLSYPEEPI